MKCELSFEDLNPFDNMWRLINTSLSQYNKLLDMNFQSIGKKESKIKEMALLLEKQLTYAREEKEGIMKKCVLLINSKK
jgi:hypothetical protein